MERPGYGRDGNNLNRANSIGRFEEDGRVRQKTQQAVLAYSFWCEGRRKKAAGVRERERDQDAQRSWAKSQQGTGVANFVREILEEAFSKRDQNSWE